MAKKKFRETEIENYYDLKKDKVDELVAALKDEGGKTETFDDEFDIAKVTGEDPAETTGRFGKRKKFDPYKIDKLSRIPVWIKAVFVKWWFAGAVCYFVIMGLGVYLSMDNSLDTIVLSGFVLGILTDIMVNPFFRMIESDKKEYDNYTMFPFPTRQFWTFFANMIYYLIVMAAVVNLYSLINLAMNAMFGTQNVIHVGVEPILYGILCVIVDMAFIGIKDGVVALVRHIKNKKKEKALNV